MSRNQATTRVLAEIGEERARQEHQHGRAPEDDDRLMLAEWAWLIAHRAHELSCPRPDEYVPHPEPRRALIEIAAISVAAIESWDRRHPRDSS